MERIPIDDGGYGAWHPIDRYRPCFELASGGMGTVFLARVVAPSAVHRFVALKRIHAHLVDEPGFLEMFHDEAHAASRIVHPNVCSVLDFDTHGKRPYIAMEYLMGETVGRVYHAVSKLSAPSSVEQACRLSARVIADACEGVHAAHELRDAQDELLDVVHRDVSPQNLFLTYEGAVKVVDFGLVRMAHCVHKTKTGIVKGKFAYLAPEALAMKPLDRRTDVWALGVVLWELLTGQRLFQRDADFNTVLAVANAPIPAPSTVRDGVPPEIDPIVLRALERGVGDRYPTARAFGRDLLRFLHAGPEPIGLSDLGEWMEHLFPGGRARKNGLLEIAGQMSGERRGSDRIPRSSERPPRSEPPRAAFDFDDGLRLGAPHAPDETERSPSQPPPASARTLRPTTLPPPPALLAEADPPTLCIPSARPRLASRNVVGAVVAAFAAAVLAAAGGCAIARAKRSADGVAHAAPSAPLPALESAPGAAPRPANGWEGSLAGYDGIVLELVPSGEGDNRHIVVRALPRGAPSVAPVDHAQRSP
jgi:serine/threonine-protein kinase